MTETPAHHTEHRASRRGDRGRRHRRHGPVESAAPFTAVTVADGVVETVARGPNGTVLPALSAAASPAAAGIHRWRSRRHRHLPPDPDARSERAGAHETADVPARVPEPAPRTVPDGTGLPSVLRRLLGRRTVRSFPARAVADSRPEGNGDPGEETDRERKGVPEGAAMRSRDPRGGTTTVERPHLPFVPAEFARTRALVRFDARLGDRLDPRPEGAVAPGSASGRTPRPHETLTLREGDEITVRRADTRDLRAARAMHRRCSTRTLNGRYHGPAEEADRYLGHLLGPRFGRALAAETPSGKLVALGHLLWDGDEAEVALLVEDVWQRRGIGAELLRRLVETAAETGRESVYAVTRTSNTGMVATMRGLGLPLDHRVEEGTLVITARLAPVPAVESCGG